MNVLTRNDLESLANEYGLLLLGLVSVEEEPAFANFRFWLEKGMHAGMKYLENYQYLRQNPRNLLPGCRTGIIFGMPCNQGDRMDPGGKKYQFRIAQYARMRDYHRSLKKRLQELGKRLIGLLPEGASFRAMTDSVPLLERALAARTERGFIGKNTLYIHPVHGSFLLLGELFLTRELKPDLAAAVEPTKRSPEGGCGSCRRCQVHCPTGALDQAYRLDARRCLAYLTIENRGTIPVQYWEHLRLYLFGCDICQLVCPWNRKVAHRVPEAARRLVNPPPLPEIVRMNQKEYESWFGGTPLTRARRAGLRRNALIAMIVSAHPDVEACLSFSEREGEPLLLATIRQIPAYKAGQKKKPSRTQL